MRVFPAMALALALALSCTALPSSGGALSLGDDMHTNVLLQASTAVEVDDAMELEEGLGTVDAPISLMQVQVAAGRMKDFMARNADYIYFMATFIFISSVGLIARNNIIIERDDSMSEVSMKKAYGRFIMQIVTLCYYFVGGCLFYGYIEPDGIGTSCRSCVYFLMVTVTTVGYGDYLPLTPLGKLFTGFYGSFGVAIVGAAATDVVNFVTAINAEADTKAASEAVADTTKQPEDRGTVSDKSEEAAHRILLIKAILPIVVFVGLGAFIQLVVEGMENNYEDCDTGKCLVWDSTATNIAWVDAVYFGFITVTTIGYGDYSFSTKYGQLFALWYLIASIVAVSNALCQLASALDKKDYSVDLEAMLADDHSGEITKDEFMARMLINLNMVEDEVLANIRQQFDILDVDGSGTLDQEDVRLIKEKYGNFALAGKDVEM